MKAPFSEALDFKDKDFLERISLTVLQIMKVLPCGRILSQPLPMFHIVFAPLRDITRTRNKFVEIVAASKRYLIINSGIKAAAVPNMSSRKIS